MQKTCDNAALAAAIGSYYRLMRARDARFRWRNPDWWKDETHATVFCARSGERVDGFLIVGSGPYADPDVTSEICDLYSRGGLAVLGALKRQARPRLAPPWGFQVMASNRRAAAVFEWLLNRQSLEWTAREAEEDGVTVIKYRVQTMRRNDARVEP